MLEEYIPCFLSNLSTASTPSYCGGGVTTPRRGRGLPQHGVVSPPQHRASLFSPWLDDGQSWCPGCHHPGLKCTLTKSRSYLNTWGRNIGLHQGWWRTIVTIVSPSKDIFAFVVVARCQKVFDKVIFFWNILGIWSKLQFCDKLWVYDKTFSVVLLVDDKVDNYFWIFCFNPWTTLFHSSPHFLMIIWNTMIIRAPGPTETYHKGRLLSSAGYENNNIFILFNRSLANITFTGAGPTKHPRGQHWQAGGQEARSLQASIGEKWPNWTGSCKLNFWGECL